MQQYIEMRLNEEKQKQQLKITPQQSSEAPVITPTLQNVEDQILMRLGEQMRSVDPLNQDRDIIDKPIQWVAGMMEVEEDPLSKIRTMEKIIYDQEKRRDKNFEIDAVKRIL